MMRTALLLIGFQRVDYFEQTLKSLEANVAAHECDLHVYLDGGPKARQSRLTTPSAAADCRATEKE